MALHSARISTVRAGGHDGQWLVEDARQNITRTHAAPCQTQNGVELPPRLMDLDGQLFNQVVVFVVAYVQVFAVFSQHADSPEVGSFHLKVKRGVDVN